MAQPSSSVINKEKGVYRSKIVHESFTSFNKANRIINTIFKGTEVVLPTKLFEKLISRMTKLSLLFVNHKRVYVSDQNFEYYRYIQAIYNTIIVKKNSSVLQFFKDGLSMKDKDTSITAKQLKRFLAKNLKLSIEKSLYKNFDGFFKHHFDNGNGSTTLQEIILAFYQKIDIKIMIKSFLEMIVVAIQEYENMINGETLRLYKSFEDIPGEGMTIESLHSAFYSISKNSINIFMALVEAKREKSVKYFDFDDFDALARKYQIFNGTSYLDTIYNDFYTPKTTLGLQNKITVMKRISKDISISLSRLSEDLESDSSSSKNESEILEVVSKERSVSNSK